MMSRVSREENSSEFLSLKLIVAPIRSRKLGITKGAITGLLDCGVLGHGAPVRVLMSDHLLSRGIAMCHCYRRRRPSECGVRHERFGRSSVNISSIVQLEVTERTKACVAIVRKEQLPAIQAATLV